MVEINNNIRDQFRLAETAIGWSIGLVNAWNEFLKDLLDNMVDNADDFVDRWTRGMRDIWLNMPDNDQYQCMKRLVLNAISGLRRARLTQIYYVNRNGL